jgi:hypothetical protein
MPTAVSRWWFALTAVAAAVGVALSVAVAIGNEAGFFDDLTERAFNVFAFFTIESNLVVGVTSALLALRPARDSLPFRVARLTAVAAIAITFVVFHTVLRGLEELHGLAVVSDAFVHTVVPVLAIAGWLAFGPRGLASLRVAAWSAVFPIAWCAFTLLRGELVGIYPYPFIDVAANGYARVAVSCLIVAVLYLAVAVGLTALDGWLVRGRRERPTGPFGR